MSAVAARRPGAGDKPLTRRGCVLGVSIWLALMLLPVCALLLALRGEVAWRRGEFVEDRLWLVQSDTRSGNSAAAGLAYSMTRIVSDQRPVDGPVCLRTRVFFLLWRGASERLTYCECHAPRAAGDFDFMGECP